jgi:hypothetical protein
MKQDFPGRNNRLVCFQSTNASVVHMIVFCVHPKLAVLRLYGTRLFITAKQVPATYPFPESLISYFV